jgi:hypothetical protein
MSFELTTMLINDIRSGNMAGLAASFEGTVSAIERKMANGEAATPQIIGLILKDQAGIKDQAGKAHALLVKVKGVLSIVCAVKV